MLSDDGKSLERMDRYKAFIVGCGKIAGLYDSKIEDYIYSHAKAYSTNNKIDIIGCYDIKSSNSMKLSKKYNIKIFCESLLDALEHTQPDIVSVCTPIESHYEYVLLILESKYCPRVIFLEKPACQNHSEFKKLVKVSNSNGVKIVVNHSRRFDNNHSNLKKQIKQNSFGKLLKIDGVYYGGWQHNGTHLVDTLQYLFDDELKIEDLINEYDLPNENDKNLDFKCKFKNNQAVVYLTTMNEFYYQLFEYDLKFENARIRIEDFGHRILFEKKIVNNMGENILMTSDYPINFNSISSPMQLAVRRIVGYLDKSYSIDDVALENVYKTMKTIWSGKKWIT
jgi:predicted dehydrogenase